LNNADDFTNPQVVANGPGLGAFIGNFPVLDVDRNLDVNGNHRLYVTWFTVGASGNDIIVSSATSNSLGSWTHTSIDPGPTTDEIPWVDVDQATGSVNIIYYKVPGTFDANSTGIHAVISTSTDQGQTFSRPVALSSMPTSMGGIDFGGMNPLLEYIGLAVHNGTLHGLWADRRSGAADIEAYAASASFHSVSGDYVLMITGDDGGAGTNDIIVLSRNAINSNFLDVTVNGSRQYRGLLASIQRIEIESKLGNDIIKIDANIGANFVIRGGAGTDEVQLLGKGDSALGKFEFFGEADNDILKIDFTNGDPLPLPGFDFNSSAATAWMMRV
jgi:hypothetical protein